jgi:formate dehydrogenase maturation protein FdhE
MAQIGSGGHDPIPIGEIAAPPFARLPEPHLLFARRAERLRTLAHGHALKSYLLFLVDPDADPVADDVASLGLDLLVRETGFRRGAVNPFLLGY